MNKSNQYHADELWRRVIEWREDGCKFEYVHEDYTKSIHYGQFADEQWHRLWVNNANANEYINIPYDLLRTCEYREFIEYVETQIGILNVVGAS